MEWKPLGPRDEKNYFIQLISAALCCCLIILIFITFSFLCGCTISLSNVSNSGSAKDLLDEQQTASPDVETTATIPLK